VWSPSKAAEFRAAKRKPSVYPTFDLMPFVGVFMVLLFIFMLTPPSHGGMSFVDLPKAQTAASQPRGVRDDAIRIVVARDGRCFFLFTTAKPEDLPDLIRTAIRAGSERKVYLFADAIAKNGGIGIVC